MPSKSKSKGNMFENQIAKMLNNVYDTEQFARAPLSGAYMGKSNAQKRSGIAHAAQDTLRGDIITPDDFPFVIECKNYNDAPLYHKVMEGCDRHLDKWIAEVEFDAAQANKQPMLFFKTTRKGSFVCLPFHCCTGSKLKAMMIYNSYVITSLDLFQTFSKHLYK